MAARADRLEQLAAAFAHAQSPEDIFGPDPARAHSAYRRLALDLHPDRQAGASERASQLFTLLGTWWASARLRLEQGTYGSGRGVWRVGDLADLYCSGDGEIVKVGRDPRDNGLLVQEADVLRHLARAEHAQHFRLFVPHLVESFQLRQAGVVRVANVLSAPSGLYSLREVLELKGPLDPRDMTWIYRRLLKVLAFAHQAGVIHGAVRPEHVLIHPDHGLTLVDWCYAVELGAPLRAVPAPARDCYPESVFARHPMRAGLDLFLAAQCMVALLGGDPKTGVLPDAIHPHLRAFLSCWWRFGVDHVQDARVVLEEFTELVDSLWPRQFRPFSLAPRGAQDVHPERTCTWVPVDGTPTPTTR